MYPYSYSDHAHAPGLSETLPGLSSDDSWECYAMDILNELGQSFLDCRFRRHRWDIKQWVNRGLDSLVYCEMVCDTCGTRRHDAMSRSGEVVKRKYTYPEGYVYRKLDRAKGESPPTIIDVRREIMLRAAQHSKGGFYDIIGRMNSDG